MKFTVIYERKRIEVDATTQLQARNEGVARLKVPPSKAYLVIAVPSSQVKHPAAVSD